jgi:glycosyltransferase involved in cell wall biosynthesis
MALARRQVTIVAHDIGRIGGMERQLEELISGLLRDGHEVTVIARTCEIAPHPRLRRVRVPGPSHPFALAYPWFFLLGSVLVSLRTRGLIHSTGAIVFNRVDICTVHFCHEALDDLPTFSRASRPGVLYRVNAWFAARMSGVAERAVYRPGRVRYLVGVSRGVARELRACFPRMAERISVVPNGVDIDAFHPAPAGERGDDGPLEALFVGGEWERKGLAVALEALAACPGVRLTVIGKGDVDSYRALAGRLGVVEQVRFVEPTDEIAARYREADVFVLPTAYETFSLATYEAAASGLPLLVTRVNGVEDLLEDGVNGWFIDRDPVVVGERLRALRDDPELRCGMGEQARRCSARFTWGHAVDGYEQLYATAAR